LCSGVLQVLSDLIALLLELIGSSDPFLEHLLETLAADALPVAFKVADVVLNLWSGLVTDLIVELHEKLSELAHYIGIYMNCSYVLNSSPFVLRVTNLV
jgi:hypothetical protein